MSGRGRGRRPPLRRIRIPCPYCTFSSFMHQRIDEHVDQRHNCQNCGDTVVDLNRHNCPLPAGSGVGQEGPLPRHLNLGLFEETESAHRGVLKKYSFIPDDRLFDEVCDIYEVVYPCLSSLLQQLIRHFGGIRVQIILPAHLVDPIHHREMYTFLTGFSYILTHPFRIDEILCMSAATQIEKLNTMLENGSIWNLLYIESFELLVSSYEPIRPQGKRQALPAFLKHRVGILNFTVGGGQCFHLAVLTSLHGAELEPAERDQRTTYEQFYELYKFQMLKAPVDIAQIGPFERENKICVNVFAVECKKVIGVRISEMDYEKEANLIILNRRDAEEYHYAGIYDFDRFANFKRDQRHYYCRRCLHAYVSPRALEKHKPTCQLFNPHHQIIEMPEPGSKESIDEFKYEKDMLLCAGFGVYDWESYLRPVATCMPDPSKSWACKTQQHMPMSYAFLVVLQNAQIFHFNYYEGPDAVDHFFETANQVANCFLEFQKNNEEIEMSDEEIQRYYTTLTCPVCKRTFDDEKHKRVRHHFHCISFDKVDSEGQPYRNNYIGPLCSNCNLKMQHKRRLTLLAHNSSRYDLKLMLSNMKRFDKKIRIIPQTGQRFIQLLLNSNLRLIDSFLHLPFSLSKLVETLKADGNSKFIFTRKVLADLPESTIVKLCKKLPFPYAYITDESKLDHVGLPHIKYFRDDLTDTPLPPKEYAELVEIFEETGCETLRDLAKMYNKLDVLQLADVMYDYVTNSYKITRLDPLHSPTLSGFAMKAMRLFTRDQPLHILTCPTQLAMVSSAMRGGINNCVQRLAYTNAKFHMGSYDPTKPEGEILCLDVNSLYAYAQTFELPVGNFRLLDDDQLKHFDLYSYGGDRGCFVTCDLRCPDDMAWAERFQRFPLAQKRFRIEFDDLSPTQHTVINEMCNEGMIHKYVSQSKLILSFFPLHNHTVHYTELQDYVARGMIMTNVTQVLEFKQKPFLREFVETFTKARQEAKSASMKNIYKLYVNAVFGRFGLQVMKFVNVHLALSRQDAKKYGAKHNFKSFYIVNDNISVFTLRRTTVKYREHWPIAAAILAISKRHMYHLYYDRLMVTFPSLKLLNMDTDSYFIYLEYRKFQSDLVEAMKELHDIMDFSNLDEDDPLYSVENSGRPGCLKSETGSVKILAFAISSAKKYFMLLYHVLRHKYDRKVASKGTPQVFLSRRSFNEFRDSIFKANPERIQFNAIRGVNMDVATLRVSKLFLSPMTTHRYLLENQIDTLPFGYPTIANVINSQDSADSSQSSM